MHIWHHTTVNLGRTAQLRAILFPPTSEKGIFRIWLYLDKYRMFSLEPIQNFDTKTLKFDCLFRNIFFLSKFRRSHWDFEWLIEPVRLFVKLYQNECEICRTIFLESSNQYDSICKPFGLVLMTVFLHAEPFILNTSSKFWQLDTKRYQTTHVLFFN